MTNVVTIVRALIIYGLCLPLAIYLGYLLALPLDRISLIIITTVLLLPLLPVLLKWHHFLLIASWNMSVVLFFIPGSPNLWIVMSCVSLLLSVIQHILVRNMKFVTVPSVILPLVFMAMVVLITAKLTGGIGLQLFGGEAVGGKRYIVLLGAIVGYFAMTSHKIQPKKALLYVAVYFLGTFTSLVGSFAPWIPPSLHYILVLFPVENLQATMEGAANYSKMYLRLGGLIISSSGALYFLLARHGIRGITNISEPWRFLPIQITGESSKLSINQPWRLLSFFAIIWIGMMGGYRSIPITFALLFLLQFHMEGLMRTRLTPILILFAILAAMIIFPFSDKMPYTIQRSLSTLPLKIDPMVKMDAESSSEWRREIWREVIPTIPQYLIVGKGYSMDARELEKIAELENFTGKAAESAQESTLASDFHNGPLSLIIPLGIFGVIAFLWFLTAGFRLLLNNYRYGDHELRQINTLLLCLFITKTIFFFLIFGSFHTELCVFTGIAGLSVSLNGGMRRPVAAPVTKPAFLPFRFARLPKPSN